MNSDIKLHFTFKVINLLDLSLLGNTPTGGGGGGQTLFPKRLTNLDSNSDNSDSDVDGMPLNIPGRKPIAPAAAAKSSAAAPGFVPSKWETIDPEDVQAQAVTSSKWDFDDKGGGGKVNKLGIAIGNDDDDTDEEDIDGKLKKLTFKRIFVPKNIFRSLVFFPDRHADVGQQQTGSSPCRRSPCPSPGD